MRCFTLWLASTVWLLLPFTTSVAEEKPLRVMSYNIRYGTAKDGINEWGKRKEFLADTIKAFDPDLLGTQETLADQRDDLIEKLTGYTAVGVGRDDGQDRGEMAALFYRKSRFKLLDSGHLWLSETPDKVGSKGWDAALPRIATWVKLEEVGTQHKPLLYLNTHFDHRGVKAREESAQLIRKYLAKHQADCRLIVTGDFNAAEGSKPYKALFADADNTVSPVVDTYRAFVPKRGKEEGTFTGFDAKAITGERIDWIGCCKNFTVKEAGIDRTSKDGRTPSDHAAVFALLLPAKP